MNIAELSTPAVLLDQRRLEQNTRAMAQRAHALGVRLRPHVKTHKCVEIGRLQVENHFGGITVSTLAEAHYFAAGGFTDITLAVPLALGRIEELLDFSLQVDAFHVLVDSIRAVEQLSARARNRQQRVSVFLKVDCGYGRAGVVPGTGEAVALARTLHEDPSIEFRGLLTHGGHSYGCHNREEILLVAEQERSVVVDFAAQLRKEGIQFPEVSVGSTPTMCVAKNLSGVTEIRPGNYAIFDAFQAAIGSCSLDDVAISVLSTVIGAYENRLVLDCGALALSKDQGPVHVDPKCGFGRLFTENFVPLDGLSLIGLSQEHGKVVGPDVQQFQVGDRIRIVPNHSCLTLACFDTAQVIERNKVVDTWSPCRGW